MNATTLHTQAPGSTAPRASIMANTLPLSEILRVAADIRGMPNGGKDVINLSVGDFNPAYFPVPELLTEYTREALKAGHTNYPPSDGVAELRVAVSKFYKEWLNLDYPVESILITAGSRPGIHAAFSVIVDPDDAVVYPVPSWNNTYYCQMTQAEQRPCITSAADDFFPTRKALENLIRGARMLVINSPSNPTGTAIKSEVLEDICDLILEENERRGSDERPLYLLYDSVYWMLTFGDTRHFNPVSLRPEMAKYTVFIDGISKSFAATGVRVGWVLGPKDLVQKMGNVLGHVGAWAPKAEQVATARLLGETAAIKAFNKTMRGNLQARLDVLHTGIAKLRSGGFPVDSVAPAGAMYLSVQFSLKGKRTPEGKVLSTNEDIRHYLLHAANPGVVPFKAFGSNDENGWFRMAVGAVSMDSVNELLPRLQKSLEALR